MKKQAVLSLSGGMDSSTVLLHLLADDYEVTAVSFDYGQKHNVELKRAKELVAYLQVNNLDVDHHVIKLDGLQELLDSNLIKGGDDVPEGHYEQENMKDTVVPNRNKMMNSIIQAVALSIANTKDTDVVITMGIHAGDHEIYPDCRQEFRDVDFEAFKVGNWDSERVSVSTPYLDTDKFGILQDGEKCCDVLGIDFDEVYKRTNTSYKPTSEGYSDYKSASSIERIEAFLKLDRQDPVQYADESGKVDWAVARDHVVNVLETYNNGVKYKKITYDEVVNACDKIAEWVNNSGIEFRGIWGLPRGGLVPSVILSHKTGLKLFDEPRVRPLLVVDDIVDTGKTLKSFSYLDDVYIVTLHYHRQAEFIPDKWVLEKTDEWIVYPWEKEYWEKN